MKRETNTHLKSHFQIVEPDSLYSVIDRVEVVVNEDLQNEKLYTISQQEVLRIERILKGKNTVHNFTARSFKN